MEDLRTLRKQAKKTATEVATVLGVTENAVYNYEKGYRMINITQVLILANEFDCSEKDIILAQLKSIELTQKGI